MQKTLSLILTSLLLMFATTAWSGSYQYQSAQDVKQALEANEPLSLVDIQVKGEFAQHHLEGALPTYAYPVKSAADQQKFEPFLKQLQAGKEPVVIICPRGEGGAKRTYDYLLSKGVSAERLFILEKGQQGWPYSELLANNSSE